MPYQPTPDLNRKSKMQMAQNASAGGASNMDRVLSRQAPNLVQPLVSVSNIFVLLDCSGSMETKIVEAAGAAVALFEHAKRGRSQTSDANVSILTFANQAREILPLQPIDAPLPVAENLLQTSGGTRLAPALELAFEKQQAWKAPKNYLKSRAWYVVLSDGAVSDFQESRAIYEKIKATGGRIVTVGFRADPSDIAQLRSLSADLFFGAAQQGALQQFFSRLGATITSNNNASPAVMQQLLLN